MRCPFRDRWPVRESSGTPRCSDTSDRAQWFLTRSAGAAERAWHQFLKHLRQVVGIKSPAEAGQGLILELIEMKMRAVTAQSRLFRGKPLPKRHSRNLSRWSRGPCRRAPDCVGGGLGEPSPFPHPKYLGPAFHSQTGGAFFLRRAPRNDPRQTASMVSEPRRSHWVGTVADQMGGDSRDAH